MSIERSIVYPDLVDVELAKSGHLADVIRVPIECADLRIGSEFTVFRKKSGRPIAFCCEKGLYMLNPPETKAEAWRQFRRIPGIADKISFLFAVRNEIRRRGKTAGLNIPRGMLYLARVQAR